jgi:hypothetical protein
MRQYLQIFQLSSTHITLLPAINYHIMSGDFIKLPLEVRYLIWGFVVIPTDVSVTFALSKAGRLVAQKRSCHGVAEHIDTTNFSLFFTDPQTSEETRRVFYSTGHISFAPDDDVVYENHSAVPERFFQLISSYDLAAIRAIQFTADRLLKTWLDGGKQVMHVLRSPWASICDILAYKYPQLQHLDLRVAYDFLDEYAPFVHR